MCGMTALPPWTLPQLEQYVDIALEVMAKEGVVGGDASGIPSVVRRPTEQAQDGTIRIKVDADLSPVRFSGLPLTIRTRGNGPVDWRLGEIPLAVIPTHWTPEEAGEAISQ